MPASESLAADTAYDSQALDNNAIDLGALPSLSDVTVDINFDLTSNIVGSGYGEDFVLGTTLNAPPCFATGTRILTEIGEVAVEALSVGQRLVTASGIAPIVWIGRRRVDCRMHPKPRMVRPRVSAGAFGAGLPRRDLVLSPDHAVFVRGVLIPVHALVDGAAIVQEECGTISYFHIELERHSILRAEGLTVESYLDTGNRSQFANAPLVSLHPAFGPGASAADPCAPMVLDGPIVESVRAGLQPPRARRRRAAG